MMLKAAQKHFFKQSNRKFSSLVVAEQFEGKLGDNIRNVVNAASQFGEEIHVLIHGKDPESQIVGVKKISGVKKILLAKHDHLENPIASDLAVVAQKVLQNGGYKRLLTPATNFGKDFIPRIAGKIDSQPITDVIKIESENKFHRPVYAGNAISIVESSDSIKLITVRPTNFEASGDGEDEVPTENVDVDGCIGGVQAEWIENKVKKYNFAVCV
jgi:electron transfer flavoprotein alpha subunit